MKKDTIIGLLCLVPTLTVAIVNPPMNTGAPFQVAFTAAEIIFLFYRPFERLEKWQNAKKRS